ncbi:MAG: GNAT family N-acetyltransferase [Rhodospirillales bacterium]|nr:GNAT family N-acetyltransferase [Rhodospirillales bacterium]
MSDLRLSPDATATLDQPILSALTTGHRHLALKGRAVVRYPAGIAPFAAFLEETDAARRELREMAGSGPIAVLRAEGADTAPVAGLETKLAATVLQMVARDIPPADPAFAPLALGAADVPEMLELTALTKPGPFFARTHELGRYVGVRIGGRLAAMAGERLRPAGFTEVSAVCVHPDFRGQGHAGALVKLLMAEIAARGETPFLHLYADNLAARTLYEKLGFAARKNLVFVVMQAP